MNELGLGRSSIAPATRPPSPSADAAYLRQLLERQPGCLIRVRRDGVLLACNDAALGLFGVDTLGAILNTNLTDRLIATERGDWQEFANRVWTGGAASVECHLAIPAGADRTVLFQGIAIKDHPDGVDSLLLSLRDTSLAHRLETSLQSEENSREGQEGRQKETREQLEQALADRQQLAAQIEQYQAERQRLSAALEAQIADGQQRETEYREKSAELEEGQKKRREQLEHALAERQQLAAQVEEYQAERQRLTAALEAQIADLQQREAEHRERSAELEDRQTGTREQLERALADRQQLTAQVEEYQAERQRLTAALEAQIADRQQREAEYREKSAELERRAEESQLAFLIREHEADDRIAGLEAELSASVAEHGRVASAYEQQLAQAGQQDLTSHDRNRQELADLELRLQAAAAEQARLLALVAEHEAHCAQLEAQHRATVDNREQALSRAREERALGIAQAHQALSELGSQLSHALGEQSRLSELMEERGRDRDRLDVEHCRAIADLETRSSDALAECERVLTDEHQQVRQQNERQRFEIADLKKRHAEAIAEQQRLSDLVRERESRQERADADRGRTIADSDARHHEALAKRARAWQAEREQMKRQCDDQQREIGSLNEGRDESVAEQRRLSELLKQTEAERQQLQAEGAADGVEFERRLAHALDQTLATRESANRERIANLQLELAQAVSDQMRLQASAAQGEGRLKRATAEYAADRAQAERAIGEAIFKKNRVLKALADQRVELQRWQDAATELEPLAAAGRLAADVAGELQEVLKHVDEQAKFVLTLCSSDAIPRAEIETLRADALRAASLARQFALSKVRQLEVPFPAEPEYARVSPGTPNESVEDL